MTQSISILSLLADVQADKNISSFKRKHALNILRSVSKHRMNIRYVRNESTVRTYITNYDKYHTRKLKTLAIDIAKQSMVQ